MQLYRANWGSECCVCTFLTYENTLCRHLTPLYFGDPDTAGATSGGVVHLQFGDPHTVEVM